MTASDEPPKISIGQGSSAARIALPCLVGRRQRFAVDHADHLVEAGVDAAVEIALLEQRRDGVVDDAAAGDVGERAFEAAADLDAHGAVVLGDDAGWRRRPGPPRPSFHASARRMPNCAMSSGSVVGRISTAICAPLRASKAASFSSSADCCAAVSVPVRSVTRASSCGSGICACAARREAREQHEREREQRGFHGDFSSRRRARAARLRPASPTATGVEVSKLTVGARRNRGFVLHGEVGLHLEVEHLRREVGRELAHRDVVGAHRIDVAVARHGDAVLRAFELRLQVAEIRVRLELGIVLGDGEQALQRLRQFALRRLEFLERLRDR